MSKIKDQVLVYQSAYYKLAHFVVSPYTWTYFQDDKEGQFDTHQGFIKDVSIKVALTLIPILPSLTVCAFAFAVMTAISAALAQFILWCVEHLDVLCSKVRLSCAL